MDENADSMSHSPAAREARGVGSIRVLLEALGEDVGRQGLAETPQRVWRSLKELTAGYEQDPQQILNAVFETDTDNGRVYDEIILLKDIPFTSLCEHHILPFSGTATVGYLPKRRVVGISKLARLVDCFARRLQIQERMTLQIAESIELYLKCDGVGVVITAEHLCMSCRGVRKPGAKMTTSALLGEMRSNPHMRSEFLGLSI